MARIRFSRSRFGLALLMGFSAGLPLLLTRSTLKAWLTEGGVDIKAVGFFSLVGLPYAFKFVWSPLMDRWAPFGLGRRRGWLVVTQLGTIAGLLALAFSDPRSGSLRFVAFAALWTAFFGASQDVVVDAYRRETFPDVELGVASSLFVFGYRMALLAAGAGALFLADLLDWRDAYLVMAAFGTVGLLTTAFAAEPRLSAPLPKTFRDSVAAPLIDFFKRDGAVTILLFVLLYKIGEQMASDMFNPFFLKTGFTKTEIAAVAKVFGIWAAIAGGFAGGWLISRMNLLWALLGFGVLQSASLLLFARLAQVGPDKRMLAMAIGCENFTSGMATAAYMSFMAIQTDRRFTATQYALLSSLLGVASALAGATTGLMVDALGWSWFFRACMLVTVPGLLLLVPLRQQALRAHRLETGASV